MKSTEIGLTALEKKVLADVLVQGNDLIGRIPGIQRDRNWGRNESNVTAKFFRAINEEMGKKRLFVCCDGTWENASGTAAPLTNVARFARAVDRYGVNTEFNASPVTQVVYYSGGVGSQSVLILPVDSVYSGATGEGLEENILSAYCFLCNNYNFAADNDDIILIGYSRGAFTVRCLADLISQIGLLRRKNLPFLYVLFKRWMEAKTPADREKMKRDIRAIEEFSFQVKIKVLAEWDPVSAIRHLGWRKKFSFINDTVPAEVDNAFVAVALDERRFCFKPMPWRKARPETNVEQCAFSGCHGDIGGGNLDAGLSTVSLLWMMAKVEDACHASFDRKALLQMVQPPRPSKRWWFPFKVKEEESINLVWSKGDVNESLKKWWLIPYIFTLGWSSGQRRRCIRKSFPERTQNQAQNQAQNLNPAQNPAQNPSPRETFSKIYEAEYQEPPNNDVTEEIEADTGANLANRISGDVASFVRDLITRVRAAEAINNRRPLEVTVKTAFNVTNNGGPGTRIKANINTAFEIGAPAAHADETAMEQNNGQANNEAADAALATCHLKAHFTVKLLAQRAQNQLPNFQASNGYLDKMLRVLQRLPCTTRRISDYDYLVEDQLSNYERRLLKEWKKQVDMWCPTSGVNRSESFDENVEYWRSTLSQIQNDEEAGTWNPTPLEWENSLISYIYRERRQVLGLL